MLPLAATLTLLAEVERALGRRAAARGALARRARPAAAASGPPRTAPDAEAVLFEADHGSPARAVALGRRVWRAAPSVRSADALGWALTRAGRPAAGYALRAARPGARLARPRLPAARRDSGQEAGLAAPAARHLAIAAAGRAALPPARGALLREAGR